MFLKLPKTLSKDCFNTLLEKNITLFMPLKCKNINAVKNLDLIMITKIF